MASPPAPPKPIPAPAPGEEEEEYESDEYEVDEDAEGAEQYEDDDDDEDDDEDEGQGRQSLTALLVPDAIPNADAFLDEDEDDDAVYAPPGETDPASAPIDGAARALTPTQLPSADTDAESTKDAAATAPLPVAAGIKRKTSGDDADGEEDGLDEEDDESDAKKLKA